MEIVRDVFLTDAREPLITVSVTSRDLAAHRLLSGLSEQERQELSGLLREHAAAVQHLLRGVLERQKAQSGTASFGCGT
jgi:hypothetical protein